MKPGVDARVVAAELVGRVNRGGAWSNVVSNDVDLPPDEARLARHLLYGTLRNRRRIDRAIDALSGRPPGTIQPEVRDVLRVAFHEVLFGRTPDHAVSDVAVEAVRHLGRPRAAGFVNALVRTIQRDGEPDPPTQLADVHSMPDWLTDELAQRWGSEETRDFLEASQRHAPIGYRMRAGDAPEGAIATSIRDAFYSGDGTVPEGAVVQDAASVAVVRALAPDAESRVLDMAAAPGGKTLAIWDEGPSRLVAVERHARRIRSAQRWTQSKGFGGMWIRADGRQLPLAEGTFDRVLLDAPCTGLGTLRRRPEIREKATPQERDRLAALQAALLEAAMAMLAPGGRLVYSVCTVTQAETEEIARRHGGAPPSGLPGRVGDHGLLLAPHLTETDGMFISVFDR